MTPVTTPTIPVTPAAQATTALEPSFADLIAAIEAAKDLPEQIRRHWPCSVRQIARWLDRPAAVIPARWQAVRNVVAQLHPARVGSVTAKTLSNHRSNVRAALRWFGEEHDVPQQGAPLSPKWMRFRDRLDKPTRSRLYSLIRYSSARGIDPSSVDDRIFDEYWRYRAQTTARASNNTARRFMVRAWNACAAAIDCWSLQRLTEPPINKTSLPGKSSPRACAGTLTTISQVSPRPTAPSTASAFSRAANQRSPIGGLSLWRWRAWQCGSSACRSKA